LKGPSAQSGGPFCCTRQNTRYSVGKEETRMLGMGEGEDCPFQFNFDPATFKVGDTVSYRVTGSLRWHLIGGERGFCNHFTR
jgi:hypothetical protein